MTNKQQQSQSQPQQSPTAQSEIDDWVAKLKLDLTAENLKEWMFSNSDSQKQILSEIKKKMIDDGIPSDLATRCTYYEESPHESVARQKLRLWSNKKSGKLHDVSTMEAAGLISTAEINGIRTAHGGKLPPYYTITGLNRIVDDRVKPPREYLLYNWLFEGIRLGNLEGQVRGESHYRINQSGIRGYTVPPNTNSDVVQGKDGEDLRVVTFNRDATRMGDNISNRNYTIPFTPAVVAALLRYSDSDQVSLGITQVSTGKNYTVKSMDEFLTSDPIALIKSLEAPKPAIDSKTLLDELERRARERAEKEIETHEQYQ